MSEAYNMVRWLRLLVLPLLAACGSDPGENRGIDEGDGGVTSDGSIQSDGGQKDASDAGGDAGPCFATMALVSTDAGLVCVDRYEGSVIARFADGGEGTWPHYLPVDGLDGGTFRAVPAAGVAPQAYISEVQAEEACRASGKRLCTIDEWTAACRGRPSADNVYPYGNVYEAGACNEGRATSPINDLFGPTPTYSAAELGDPRCDQLPNTVAPGGAFTRCVSAYGVFDMHGNVHEWVSDSVAGDATRGNFLGGYFVDAKINGPGCEYRTTAHQKTYHDYSTGFRCCADPK